MNERIRHILSQISSLEDELHETLQQQEQRILFKVNGKRIEFEHTAEQAHCQLKVGVFRWFLNVRPSATALSQYH